MANTRGGYVVMGVRNADFAPVGLPTTAHLDSASLKNHLDNFVTEHLDWVLAHHSLEIGGGAAPLRPTLTLRLQRPQLSQRRTARIARTGARKWRSVKVNGW